MKIQTVESLLNIASMANRWPRLAHLREEALRELEEAHLSTIDFVQPVMIVEDERAKRGAA